MNEPQQSNSAYASAESSPNTSLSQSSTSLCMSPSAHSLPPTDEQMRNEQHKKLMKELVTVMKDSQLPVVKSPSAKQENVREIVDNTIKTSMHEMNAKLQQQTTPKSNTSPNKSSSVLSFIEKIFNKNSDKQNKQALPNNLSTTSSSSPNPDCSPYKLLSHEIHTSESCKTSSALLNLQLNSTNSMRPTIPSTLSPNGTTIHDAVAIFNAATRTQEGITSKSVETLALLNSREHEQADPILSQIKASHKVTYQQMTHDETNNAHVPATSEEFAMKLNFNLASAAASSAPAPVVVQDNLKLLNQATNQTLNQRFTSNASTSSIHNDLKKILEESKGNKKIIQQTIKPQKVDLVKLAKEVTSSYNKNRPVRYSKDVLLQIRDDRVVFIEEICKPDVFKAYCYCTNGKYWDPEKYFDITENRPINTNTKRFNQNYQNDNRRNTPSNQHFTAKKFQVNDLMNRVNSELKNANVQQISLANYSTESPQPLQVPKNSPKSVQSHKGKKKTSSLQQSSSNNILGDLGLYNNAAHSASTDGDQLNADKIILGLIKKNTNEKDKQLLEILNLNKKISNSNYKPTSSCHNIMDFFNGTSVTVQTPTPETTTTLLSQRFNPTVMLAAQELERSQLNQPSHMSTKSSNKNHLNKSNGSTSSNHSNSSRGVNNTSSSSSRSSNNEHKSFKPTSNLRSLIDSSSNLDLNNSSVAYKQLVKNLSNHPLNTPPQGCAKSLSQDNILYKLSKKMTNTTSGVSSPLTMNEMDGTNVLKHMLKMKTDNDDSKKSSDDKGEKKSKSKRHTHRSSKSKSKDTTIESTKTQKFPSINPHEKPFQTLPVKHSGEIINLPSPSNDQFATMMQKAKEQHEQNNFNMLLSKIMPDFVNQLQIGQTSQHGVSNANNNILKWFPDAQTVQQQHQQPHQHHQQQQPHQTMPHKVAYKPVSTLSEIEFMQLNSSSRPTTGLY